MHLISTHFSANRPQTSVVPHIYQIWRRSMECLTDNLKQQLIPWWSKAIDGLIEMISAMRTSIKMMAIMQISILNLRNDTTNIKEKLSTPLVIPHNRNDAVTTTGMPTFKHYLMKLIQLQQNMDTSGTSSWIWLYLWQNHWYSTR